MMNTLIKLVSDYVLMFMLPPCGFETPEDRHRWSISLHMVMIYLCLSVHITWVCGLLPGLAGVAWANDMTTLQQQLKQFELRALENDLRSAVLKRCVLRNGNNQEALDYVNKDIAVLKSRWEDLASTDQIRRVYRAEPCEVLLAVRRAGAPE